ncbi:MAG: helix-turn-helix transcriptional regulator, partial [candidate division WOR-3 bacterium]
MVKNKFIFTKEIARLLVAFRKTARLTQAEMAEQIGLSRKSGKKYISLLETGRIKNPSLGTIILYLDACNVSYETFFNKLSQLRFTQRQEEIMRQVKLPANFRLQKKLDRDTALYAHKIRHQIRKPMLDIDKLKTKIDRELSKYLSDHQISDDLKPIYQDFADYVLKRALNPEPNPPLDTKPWQK